MPASNEETRQPQKSFEGTSFLGGARTGSPEPWIKPEFPPESTMADVSRYSSEVFEEGLLNQAKPRSRDPPPHRDKRKYTKRKSADSAVTKPTPTRRQSVATMPEGMVTCNGCKIFYKGAHSKCLGSTDASKRCLRHTSARHEKKASERATAQALQAESEQ